MTGAPSVGLPAIGDTIADKYRLDRVIGEGGMGIVFEATHLRLQQRVAIKVLQPGVLASAEVVSRFDREARAAGKLRGRYVARVLDVDVTGASAGQRLPYMVMEYLDGRDLQSELERRGVLPVEEAVDYVLQACTGMAEAHDIGIVHRDLKPSNLFLATDGEARIVKVLDFGISKIVGEASKLTTTEITIGTPLYMSPEQVRSAKSVDARTDVWALGIILFELLTGRPPWTGSGPSVAAAIVTDDPPPIAGLRAGVPPELDAAIRVALAKKPERRFADVRAFAAAIAPFASHAVRASTEAPLRARAGYSTPPTGIRPDDVLAAHAPTLPGALDSALADTRAASPVAPSSSDRTASVTTAGWTTGGVATRARRAKRRNAALLVVACALGGGGAVALAVARRAPRVPAPAAEPPPLLASAAESPPAVSPSAAPATPPATGAPATPAAPAPAAARSAGVAHHAAPHAHPTAPPAPPASSPAPAPHATASAAPAPGPAVPPLHF